MADPQLLFHGTDVTDGSGCRGGIHCPGHLPADLAGEAITTRTAAVEYLDRCSVKPTPEAVAQLTEVFLPALRIVAERDYDPNGATWREGGWRGLLGEMRKKFGRLWYRAWKHGRYDHDSAIDMINYLAYYVRLHHEGEPWGEWGDPDGG